MLFWTIIFIVFYLASIVKGDLFYDLMKKNGELMLKNAITEDKSEKEEISKRMIKQSLTMFLAIPLIIALYIYLFKAIKIDVYKYPSIFMLFYLLLTTFVFKSKNKSKQDLTTEEGRMRFKIELESKKRYTFKGFVKQSILLSYFIYMFYILVLR